MVSPIVERSAIKMRNFSIRRDGFRVSGDLLLGNIGEIVALVGRNGSGKSTLAQGLLGDFVFEGTIQGAVGSYDVRPPGRKLRLQRTVQLFDLDAVGSMPADLTVGQLVSSYVPIRTLLNAFTFYRVAPPPIVVQYVGGEVCREPFLSKRVGDLSSGERQNTCVLCLLASLEYYRCKLLVLDEVTSNLDAPAAAYWFDNVRELAHRYAFCALVISHDLRAVSKCAHRAYVVRSCGSSNRIESVAEWAISGPEEREAILEQNLLNART